MDKQQVIEFIEDYLVGGNAPMDLRGKYHHNVLAEWIGAAMKALIHRDKVSGNGGYYLGGMSQHFDVPVSESGSDFLAILPASPLGGTSGVMSMFDSENNMIGFLRGGAESTILNYLKGGCGCRATLEGKNLIFKKSPGAEIHVVMVPDIKDMDDEDDLNMPEGMLLEVAGLVREYLIDKRALQEDKKNDDVANG